MAPSSARELQNYPDGEILEMIALFESRGMSRADAEVVGSIVHATGPRGRDRS